jgi:NADPH-dependent 2,4-dienoyl-CoA reductase/sulfur reductase-like enzyme
MGASRYLIVGTGMTAHAAAVGIREVDPEGPILMIGAEHHPPYARPPLSKGLWAEKPLESIWLSETIDGVERRLGRTVVSIDLQKREVFDDLGVAHPYEKLLLATGGRPRTLAGAEPGTVVYYRTIDDYLRVRELCERGSRIAVLGAGFIGMEMASALRAAGKHVVMIFPEQAVGGGMFPSELAAFLSTRFRDEGVEVWAGQSVQRVWRVGEGLRVAADSGEEWQVDGVVAGLGIEPNVELAVRAGLQVQDGICVDEKLQTSAPDTYAAGDVARFHNPFVGSWLRVEHEDNANTMGVQAGRSMAGAQATYYHLPFFYSDMFDIGYEGVGELDPRCETYADWKTPFREGAVYYLREGRVVGVLLWGMSGQVEAARVLIAESGPFGARELTGRLG